MSKEKHDIQTTLNPAAYKHFLKVKEDLGLEHNTNVLKYLIEKEYLRITKSQLVPIPFNKEDFNQIAEWAKKCGQTPQQFVNDALTNLVKTQKCEADEK